VYTCLKKLNPIGLANAKENHIHPKKPTMQAQQGFFEMVGALQNRKTKKGKAVEFPTKSFDILSAIEAHKEFKNEINRIWPSIYPIDQFDKIGFQAYLDVKASPVLKRFIHLFDSLDIFIRRIIITYLGSISVNRINASMDRILRHPCVKPDDFMFWTLSGCTFDFQSLGSISPDIVIARRCILPRMETFLNVFTIKELDDEFPADTFPPYCRRSKSETKQSFIQRLFNTMKAQLFDGSSLTPREYLRDTTYLIIKLKDLVKKSQQKIMRRLNAKAGGGVEVKGGGEVGEVAIKRRKMH